MIDKRNKVLGYIKKYYEREYKYSFLKEKYRFLTKKSLVIWVPISLKL